MSKKSNSISGAEMTLRFHAPKFHRELIDARTASLQEAGNPEDLMAWKEQLQQKDELWKSILKDNPVMEKQIIDREILQEAVRSYAQEFSGRIPEIDANVLHESIEDIMQHEMDSPWDHNAPPLDMRHVAANQIGAFNAKQEAQERDNMTIEGKAFSAELSKHAPRVEAAEQETPRMESPHPDPKVELKGFIAEQKEIGKELDEQVNTQKQEQKQEASEQTINIKKPKIDPPEQG